MGSTALFVILCALGAGMVYWHRPGTRTNLFDPHLYWALALSAVVVALFLIGDANEYGQRLTLTVKELRIPLKDATTDGTYFVVGPQAGNSDLVVGPYADPARSAEVYRDALDGLLTIRRGQSVWQVCGRSVAEDSAANLPGMRVRFDGAPVTDTACRPLTRAPVQALIERTGADGNQKRRHLSISLATDHVTIGLRADEYLEKSIGRCSQLLDSRDGAVDDRLRLAPAGLYGEDQGVRVPDNLVIDQLGQGQGGRRAFLMPSKLGPIGQMARLCGSVEQRLAWPAGASEARLVMTARTTKIAWWIVVLILFSTLYTARFCKAQWRDGCGRTEGALVIALQWLLTVRLMVAMSGFPNDEILTLPDVLWPPAMAFVCLPLLAIALLRGHAKGDGMALALLGLQIPSAWAFIAVSLDGQRPGIQETLLGIVTLTLLALRGASRSDQPLAYIFIGQARALALGVTARVRALIPVRASERRSDTKSATDDPQTLQTSTTGSAREEAPSAPFRAGLALATAIVLVRFGIAAIGRFSDPPIWQERLNGLPIVENLPLSLVYAPLAIIAMALMISGYRQAPRLDRAFAISVTFGAVFLVVATWVHDLGIILIFGVPAAWAIAKLAAVRPREGGARAALTRLLLIGPLLSPVLLLGAYYAMFAVELPLPTDNVAEYMRRVPEWDANLVRLQRYVDADYLVNVGTTGALGMLEQAAQLEPITGDTIGNGYMSASGIVRPLLNYQYSDNLLAVQIAWPFGRLGLAALLCGLLVTLMGLRGNSAPPIRESWLGHASSLAAMTVFWSGAYMALANLNLLPFTGRNFYLLAARSMGDLAEGFVLFLLVALPFAIAPLAARNKP